jgi:hypothetical protein
MNLQYSKLFVIFYHIKMIVSFIQSLFFLVPPFFCLYKSIHNLTTIKDVNMQNTIFVKIGESLNFGSIKAFIKFHTTQ